MTVPDPVAGYVYRADLAARCMPTERRVTVLQAPGGFGKTTLLAACCRALAARGVPTAWLLLGEQDGPASLDAYLAFALQRAGLDVTGALPDGATAQAAFQRTALLLRAVEAYGAPCVLALDEVERLADPTSAAFVGTLVAAGPRNLHLALAGRELPPGLDIAAAVFDAPAEILLAEDLRFSLAEIARFFDLTLSRRRLAAVAEASAGWPIAVRMHRNRGRDPAPGEQRFARDVIAGWIESRLWSHLPADDREFLLDVGLFDRVDGELIDEALECHGSLGRLQGMACLVGLLEPVRARGARIYRMHPLLREHCAAYRQRATPERYRAVQRRIAAALARRGETVSAMRHAAAADDPALVGRILMDAGGLRLWLQQGVDRLVEADRQLTEDAIARHPRLALVRCAALALTGRLAEARRRLEDVDRWGHPPGLGEAPPGGDTHPALARRGHPLGGVGVPNLGPGGARPGPPPDAARGLPEDPPPPPSGDGPVGDPEFLIERDLVLGTVALYGCEPLESPRSRAAVAAHTRLADTETVEPAVRALAEYSLCLFHNLRAEFGVSRQWALRARRRADGRSRYLVMLVDLQLGQAAMAQGRVRDATNWYRRARRVARAAFLHDPRPTVFAEVLTRELHLERNRISERDRARRVPPELCRSGAPFVSYAAAADMAAETALDERGPDAALAALEDMWAHARNDRLPALARFLGALRVSFLADALRPAEAERAWRGARLPHAPDAILDLRGQTWRECEALACARVRLLVARGDFDAARNLCRRLTDVAARNGLTRTAMRGLALAVALEERAGRRAAAIERLDAFLGLFEATDYARPLVRERGPVLPVLEDFVRRHRGDPGTATDRGDRPRAESDGTPRAGAATALLPALRSGQAAVLPAPPQLSARQSDVLARLETHSDREIAAALGLTRDGVRYHVTHLFAALRVRDRRDAVRRGRALGLVG